MESAEVTVKSETHEQQPAEAKNGSSGGGADTPDDALGRPVDWRPQDKCYFCVDGKLLTVNERGDLVAESGPAQSEPELANRVSIFINYISDVVYLILSLN